MWRSRVLGLAFGAMASGAIAQDIAFDPELTEACLAGATSEGTDPEDCIGASANACMSTPDGSTTYGMGYCLDAEWQWWDSRLNSVYGEAMNAHKATDAEMKAIGATVPMLADNLKAMQRAWIPFRDAACDYEMAQWGGGTGQGPALVGCLMVQTARQTLLIENRVSE